jgi:hypothetical protein
MSLKGDIKFQKTLALAASASNPFEAEAAEFAARRLMEQHKIDPTDIPDRSLYNRMNFAENSLLTKLRYEWIEQHPPPQDVEEIIINQRPLNSPAIPFRMSSYSKHARNSKRNNPRQFDNTKVTLEMLEQIHAMLKQNILPVVIRRKFDLTRGQIAGIKGRYDEKLRVNSKNVSDRSPATPSASTGHANGSSGSEA